MGKFLIAVAISSLIISSAFAQNVSPTAAPPTAEQVNDLSVQLNLTQQQLAEANKNFVAERSQTIGLSRQLNSALAEINKKDAKIKDLEGQIESARKSEKAAEGHIIPKPPMSVTTPDAAKP